MHPDRFIGGWRQLVGRVKEGWGLLTDDGAVAHAGRREWRLGRRQQRDGEARDEAACALADWQQACRVGRHRSQHRHPPPTWQSDAP